MKVTAHVTTDSLERAKQIAWNADDYRPGETIVMQQEMESYEPEGPEVLGAWEL